MKKSFIILLLVFILTGCKNKNYKFTNSLTYDNVIINNNKKSIDIKITFDKTELKAVSYGVVIKFGKINNINELVVENNIYKETDVINDNAYIISYDNDFSPHFKDDINIRSYYKYKDNSSTKTLYSYTYESYSLLDLALVNPGDLSTKIIDTNDDNKLKEISFSLDLTTSNYTVTSNSEDYTTELIPDKNYNYVVVLITLKKGIKLDENFKVIVNNNEVNNKYITINENKITYKIDDPNWSDIY